MIGQLTLNELMLDGKVVRMTVFPGSALRPYLS
jgi:hypothetical protein